MKADAGAGFESAAACGTSFRALVAADWCKMRRTWLLPLTVMGPLGVTLMGVILFAMRGEYMLVPFRAGSDSGWQVVIGQLGMIQVFAMGLGATLVASMIVDIEHRSDTWKSLFAMPVRRASAYAAKFAWAAALLAVSSVLMSCGYALLMLWQGLGPLPWADLGKAALLPWIGVLPLLAFQLLLSTAMKNQALPIALGVVTPMFGMGMSNLPAWLLWRLPTEAMTFVARGDVSGSQGASLSWLTPEVLPLVSTAWVVGLVIIGCVLLARREIR
ncbi:MAG: ABC transporter permease subunit [Coriobacteriia bacterium]|nr:ABC transporter permease subunit [Coriobacteriia bacterium]